MTKQQELEQLVDELTFQRDHLKGKIELINDMLYICEGHTSFERAQSNSRLIASLIKLTEQIKQEMGNH